jgi:RNA 3'-terminal phosphate cyclase (ATP)
MQRAGFYPRGGGEVRVVVQPVAALAPLDLSDRGKLLRIRAISAVSGLPRRIAERQADRLSRRLGNAGYEVEIEIAELEASCSGDSLFLWAEFERSRAGFGALGERGKPAERVGDEAADALLAFLAGGAATDRHLADQIVLLMALASGRSVLTTAQVSQHLLTNLWTVRQFLPVLTSLEGRMDEPGRLTVEGAGIEIPAKAAVMGSPA